MKHQQWGPIGTVVGTRFIQHLHQWSGKENTAKSSNLKMITSSSGRQWGTPEVYNTEWIKMQQISFAVSKIEVMYLEKNNMKCTYMQNSQLAISPQENDHETTVYWNLSPSVWWETKRESAKHKASSEKVLTIRQVPFYHHVKPHLENFRFLGPQEEHSGVRQVAKEGSWNDWGLL